MSYPGGKGGRGVAQIIINQQPPHTRYFEPFLGGGSVMLAKRAARFNVGIDLNASTIAQFEGAAGSTLPFFMLKVEDGIQFLESWPFQTSDLVYCDPPYPLWTRRVNRRLYKCEMTDNDHRRLLRVLNSLPCMVQISSYWNSLYAEMLEGWRLIRFQSMTRRGPAEECLWMNYPEPNALHDYRYLGEGFRERERIGRKVSRWRSRLAKLPALEKLAVLSAMRDLSADTDRAGDATRPNAAAADIAASGVGRRPESPALSMIDRAATETAVLQ
jgi:16S rRNA G966 N2-methylase RsmD